MLNFRIVNSSILVEQKGLTRNNLVSSFVNIEKDVKSSSHKRNFITCSYSICREHESAGGRAKSFPANLERVFLLHFSEKFVIAASPFSLRGESFLTKREIYSSMIFDNSECFCSRGRDKMINRTLVSLLLASVT